MKKILMISCLLLFSSSVTAAEATVPDAEVPLNPDEITLEQTTSTSEHTTSTANTITNTANATEDANSQLNAIKNTIKDAIKEEMGALKEEMSSMTQFIKASYARVLTIADKLERKDEAEQRALSAITGKESLEDAVAEVELVANAMEADKAPSTTPASRPVSASSIYHMPATLPR